MSPRNKPNKHGTKNIRMVRQLDALGSFKPARKAFPFAISYLDKSIVFL